MSIGDFSVESMGGAPWDERPAGSWSEDSSEARMARLVRTIEGEIVPRMVLARRVSSVTVEVRSGQTKKPDEFDVAELVRLLLAHEAGVAAAYVATVRIRGATLESICLELLAPAARELGLLWEEDECDFMQVTVGLCRLHQVLRELSPAFGEVECDHDPDRRILLAPCPGEQHTFGLTLVAQFLRRAGWDVWHEFPNTATDLLDLVRQTSFTVVGLSIGSETRLDDVSLAIKSIRQASRNRQVGIMVGGPVLVARPELTSVMGADATALDGRQAVRQAEQIRSERRAGSGIRTSV
jgi:MerR family transcriptional regulator, light-induced transcriptional regulator